MAPRPAKSTGNKQRQGKRTGGNFKIKCVKTIAFFGRILYNGFDWFFGLGVVLLLLSPNIKARFDRVFPDAFGS